MYKAVKGDGAGMVSVIITITQMVSEENIQEVPSSL